MEENNKLLVDLMESIKPKDTLLEVKKIFSFSYNPGEFDRIYFTFNEIIKLFNGEFPGYNSCNTLYHNLNHTMEIFLASARLFDGYNDIEKKIEPDLIINLLIACLFHDTGYIQGESDTNGTGAKYTENHIQRSIDFLNTHLDHFNIKKEEAEIISKFIQCTNLKTGLELIPFSNSEEKAVGFILGSADILGQMSDREYVERLLFLYYEFREAGIPGYNTEFDIIRKTLDFYETINERLIIKFNSICNYAKFYFLVRHNINKNLYMDYLNKNIEYLKKIIDDDSTNFRKKLRRGNVLGNFEFSIK